MADFTPATNLPSGRVVGIFSRIGVDTVADADRKPDETPASLTAKFVPDIKAARLKNKTAVPPRSHFLDPVTVTSSQGAIVLDDVDFVELTSNMIPGFEPGPGEWRWRCELYVDTKLVESFLFDVPMNAGSNGIPAVDLTLVTPATPGTPAPAWYVALRELEAIVAAGGGGGGGGATDQQVATAVANYFANNPLEPGDIAGLVEALAAKVTRPANPTSAAALVIGTDGSISSMAYSMSGAVNALARRDAAGHLTVATTAPTSAGQVVSKTYLETVIAALSLPIASVTGLPEALSGLSDAKLAKPTTPAVGSVVSIATDGSVGTVELSTAATPNAVPRRGASGQIPVPTTPVADTDAASRKFVVDQVAAGGGGSTVTNTVSPTRALSKLIAACALRATIPVPIVYTGSSTTAGSNATATANRFVNILTGMIQTQYPLAGASPAMKNDLATAVAATPLTAPGVQGINAGIAGTTSANWLTDATSDQIAALNPRAIFVGIGPNDYGNNTPPATFKANVLSRIAYLKTKLTVPCVFVLWHSYERMDVTGRTYAWSLYGTALREIAEADPDNVAFLNLQPAYVAVGVGGGLTDPLDLLDTDNLHQRNTGHAFMADLIRQGLTIPLITASASAPTTPVDPDPTPTAYTPFTSDSFSGANATTLAGRSSDTLAGGGTAMAYQGTASSFGILDGACVVGSTAAAGSALFGPGAPNNIAIRVRVVTRPSAAMYLPFNRTATSGGSSTGQYRVVLGLTTVQLAKTVSGSSTNVNLGAARPYANGDIVEARKVHSADGTTATLELLVNGVVVETYVDTTPNPPVTNGYAGLACNASTTWTLEDLAVFAYAPV